MPLNNAIANQQVLLLDYKSFKATAPKQNIYFPYLLKEYRNRWFLICRTKKNETLFTLALDRIVSFQELQEEVFVPYKGVDFDCYYNDLLGVTKSERDRGQKVILFFDNTMAPYVFTKPLHPSQQVLSEDKTGVIIKIDIVINFELEREILGFGESVKVLAPRLLVSHIKRRIQASLNHYNETKKSDSVTTKKSGLSIDKETE